MATVVEGDPKAPFSIATTPRCRRERYSFPWIAPLYPRSCNDRANCSLLCYCKKKGNTGMRTRILMSFKKFNDNQKDSPCAVSLYMEENSCK